jgi:hypothetical protein
MRIPMPHAERKKRAVGPAAVGAVGPEQRRQLLLRDEISNTHFLIDTGAEVSLLPASQAAASASKMPNQHPS